MQTQRQSQMVSCILPHCELHAAGSSVPSDPTLFIRMGTYAQDAVYEN